VNASWISALTTIAIAVGGAAVWAGRYGWRVISRTTRFLDDYFGEPASGGLPGRPGVMARLQSVEQLVTKVAEDVSRVAQETRPNGGTSLHDVVARTEQAVAGIRDEQAAMRTRMEQLETQRAGREEGPS
jgi:hypothetical protein